ncbi:MAG: cupin domain-containing protein [Promethearchaeota archaeon]
MKIKHFTEVKKEEVTAYGSTDTEIRWLITKEDGAPRFALRRFVIHPKGQVGLHGHPEEHEIYILQGKARVFNDKGEEVIAEEGNVLYVPPDEPHGYENVGSEDFVFLCVIPYLNKAKK